MSKVKLFFTAAALLALFLLGLIFIKNRIGDIRPAVLPPRQDITKFIPQAQKKLAGSPVSFPLKLAPGYEIYIFSSGLPGARDLEFSPGGTLLVSQTSQGKVVALPDKNGDGQVDEKREILTGLKRPHGLAFYPFDDTQGKQAKLFVAEETRVVRYNWDEEELKATLDKVLFSLPPGGNHFTRSIVFDRKGRVFISIGSTCNVCYESHPWYASVIVSDADGNNPGVFAKGLRNAVFLTVHPETDQVWVTEMGRDLLGDDIPPDEINILKDSSLPASGSGPRDYGWPLCYGSRVHDTNFDKKFYIQVIPQPPCGTAETPVYQVQAHSAPLGLTFINSPIFPPDWQGDLLVAYHGSWNRSVPTGYKVVRLKVRGDKVAGEEDFITGFLPESSSQALGRPVDLIMNQEALFISDDKAGLVYSVSKKS